jgi:hypothetical protein
MGDTRNGLAALGAFAQVALTSPTASAISADLGELAIKAPPTQPAGTKSGTEQVQRDNFRQCIAMNGDMAE